MSFPKFCTCTDLKCKVHPANHDEGCNLCVAKNLKQHEIPSCFFRTISDAVHSDSDFSYEGFAKVLLEKNKSP